MTTKVWYHTCIEYDAFGSPTLVNSFTTVAKDSDTKKGKKAKPKSVQVTSTETEDLF